jgi:hypothetical protein
MSDDAPAAAASVVKAEQLHGPGRCSAAFVLEENGEICLLTAGGDGKLCIRDVQTLDAKRTHNEGKPIECMAVHAESRAVVIGVEHQAKVGRCHSHQKHLRIPVVLPASNGPRRGQEAGHA